jgi:hypothetical protein
MEEVHACFDVVIFGYLLSPFRGYTAKMATSFPLIKSFVGRGRRG